MSIDQDTTEAFAVLARRVRRLETQVAYALSGGPCVTFVCGATGWRGTGGVIPRTLVHEVAFQLDTGGNPRGAYTVDLQYDRAAVDEVAAAEYCFMTGQNSKIGVGADWSAIIGPFNEIDTTSIICYTIGWINVTTEGYLTYTLGEDNISDDGWYSLIGVVDVDVKGFYYRSLIWSEQSNIGSVPSGDWVVSHFNMGSFCDVILGSGDDNWYGFLYGYNNDMVGDMYVNFLIGENCDFRNLSYNFGFGEMIHSELPAPAIYYDGRWVWNSKVGGQTSIFSQRVTVWDWLVAWTTGFQFPIPVDEVWSFEAKLVGTETGCANSYIWKIEGNIENDGGVTTFLGVPVVTNVYRDVITKEWQVVADNVNDQLVFQFRDTAGPDPTDCGVTLTMEVTEVEG